jgi:hypothetical protein
MSGGRADTNTHTHTSMQVGVYDCMRSDSESELGHQLSGILRNLNKQTCILVCLCMYVCLRSESESASHSSPLQLKGVRVISACMSARVRAGTTSLISVYSVRSFTGVHRDIKTQKTKPHCQHKKIHVKVMIEHQHLHSSIVSQY